MRFMLALAALGLAVSYAAQASADTYTANVFENGFATGPCIPASGASINNAVSTPVSSFLTCGPIGGTIIGSSASSPGHTGAFLQNFSGGGTFSEAYFQTLVTIKPPASFTGTEIPIALNLAVEGIAGIGNDGAEGWSATGEIAHTDFVYGTTLTASSTGPIVNINPVERSMNFTSGIGDTFPGPGSELVSGILTTPFVTVGVNLPVNIMFGIELVGSGTLDDEFLGSLDFPTGSDVFVLPEGFTAEDPSAFIVDNRFVLPGAVGVPEPSGWLLLAAGMLAFAGFRRSRAARR